MSNKKAKPKKEEQAPVLRWQAMAYDKQKRRMDAVGVLLFSAKDSEEAEAFLWKTPLTHCPEVREKIGAFIFREIKPEAELLMLWEGGVWIG